MCQKCVRHPGAVAVPALFAHRSLRCAKILGCGLRLGHGTLDSIEL